MGKGAAATSGRNSSRGGAKILFSLAGVESELTPAIDAGTLKLSYRFKGAQGQRIIFRVPEALAGRVSRADGSALEAETGFSPTSDDYSVDITVR